MKGTRIFSHGTESITMGAVKPRAVENLPVGNLYCRGFLLRYTIVNASTTSTIAAADLKTIMGTVKFSVGSNIIVNELGIDDLRHLAIMSGLDDLDSITTLAASSTGEYHIPILFENHILVDPLDTCPHVNQLKDQPTFVFTFGTVAGANLGSGSSVSIVGVYFERKNVYLAPLLTFNRQTISVTGTGSFRIANPSIYIGIVSGLTSLGTTTGDIYIGGENISNGGRLADLNSPVGFSYADFNDDPYAGNVVMLSLPKRMFSLTAPFPAGLEIGYQNISDSGFFPFKVLSAELLSVVASKGSRVVPSVVSPVKL